MVPLVDITVDNNDMEMLCVLIDDGRAEMTRTALDFFLKNWESVPPVFGNPLSLLLG